MNIIELNGEDFKTKADFHKILKERLNLPNYYGSNLDALWDCITTDVKLPLKIIWKDFNKSKENLGDYAYYAVTLFREAAVYHKEDFTFVVKE
jgi:ribonuclease inhibitor